MKDWIRGILRARKAQRLLRSEGVMTGHGFKFSGPSTMKEGVFEQAETEVLCKLLAKADRFVNVGANFGYFVCLAQSMNVPTIAVEPVPVNLELLRKNIAQNGFERGVTVHACACGETAGQAEIFGVGTGASFVKGWARNPESLHHTVDVRPLDDIVAADSLSGRSVFLVDVEGFELEVLKGADAILSLKDKPIWLLESGLSDHRQGGELNPMFEEVFALLQRHGYDMYCINRPEQAVSGAEIRRSLETGKDLIGGHNFLLVPEGHAIGNLLG